MTRVGLFGGTFDPIHNAHLEMARAACRQCDLDRVLFIPAKQPPHRAAVACFADRYRMVEIACRANPSFEPSPVEDRPGASYTIDTVRALQQALGDAAVLYFIIGADAFRDIQSWHRWRELAQQITFAIAGRPGADYHIPHGICAHQLEGVALPISASGIRAQLAAGQAHEDLPPGVLRYIREHGLYGISPDDLLIREITVHDAAVAAQLSAELGYPVAPQVMENRIASLSRLPNRVVYVACISGEVAGWIDLCLASHLAAGTRAEICGLVVASGMRNRGIGRRLLDRAERWAREQNLETMVVRSRDTRAAAHRFYLSHGYQRTKTSAVFTKELTR